MEVKAGYTVTSFPSEVSGQAYLCVVLTRRFAINHTDGTCEDWSDPIDLNYVDSFFEGDDPQSSSVQFPADIVPLKPNVDILMHGTARVTGKRARKRWQVVLQVGEWSKTLDVTGPRSCIYVPPKGRGKSRKYQHPQFSEPTAIKELPLRYESSFGGKSRYIPTDKALYDSAVEKSAALQDQLAADDASPGGPDMDPEVAAALNKEDWWEEAEDRPVEEDTSVRRVKEGRGSDDVLLDDEHLRADDAGIPIMAKDEAIEEGGGPGGRSGAAGSTRVLDPAKLVEQRLVDEGWEGDFAPDAPKPKVDEEDSPYPLLPCPNNPLGLGYAVCYDKDILSALQLPQIEDPNRPLLPTDVPVNIQKIDSVPFPAGFGPIPVSWFPRASRVGLDEEGQAAIREKMDDMILNMDPNDPDQQNAIIALADIEPPRFDARMHNCAPDDQQIANLNGTESVRIEGVSHDGPILFDLPDKQPKVLVNRGLGSEPMDVTLDTLMIHTDEDWVTMSWRGRFTMADIDEYTTYPMVDIDVLDLDSESFHAHMADLKNKEGQTRILDPSLGLLEDSLDTPPTADELKDDSAWVEGVDQEVSPLVLDGAALKDGDMDEKAKKMAEQAKKRQEVANLKARALANQEKEKKAQEKAQAKAAKETKKTATAKKKPNTSKKTSKGGKKK